MEGEGGRCEHHCCSGTYPLENGDRLTRPEFHRRHTEHPEIRRAKLIEGVVSVPSPVGRDHRIREGWMSAWLGTFASATPGVEVLPSVTTLLGPENEVQPHIAVMRASIAEGDVSRYVDRAPELVVEISATSASYDLHDKMEVYRRAGVQEYIVWRVVDEAIDWFELRDGRYERREPDDGGIVASGVFAGLRLNVPAMLAGIWRPC